MIESTKDLDAGRTEALQGLLDCLGHRTSDNPSSGALLPSEQLHSLSQKINEVLGDSVEHDSELAPGDQFVNEDGLPIIDISEPVDEHYRAHTSSPSVSEDDLIPLSLLPPDEREWRRRERDRILDFLEEEEHLEQLQEEQDAERERNDAIKKRRESARAELEQLKAARELQKKMGRALVQHANGMAENQREGDMYAKPQTSSPVPKNSVSFADAPIAEGNGREIQTVSCQSGWGDVIPGRLRAKSCLPQVSTPQAQEYPVKTRVVERRPSGTFPSPSRCADSDDESTSSAGRTSPLAHGNDSSEEMDAEYSSGNNSGSSSDEPLEEGFDFETAQHHREIALEYHKKRHAIGAEAARAMTGNTLDECEQHKTSPLSRFRADRMAAAYDKSHGPVSTSIGQSVIPASRQKSLRNSVRLGKLENGQLVGGDSGASGSEDETVREVIQMLKTGNIRNAGPDFNPSSISTVAAPPESDALESPSVVTSSASYGAKPSKFKLARGGGHTETTNLQRNHSEDNAQSQPAVSRVVERKPAKSTRGQHFTVNRPSLRSPAEISETVSPMAVGSPSFAITASTSTTIPSSSLHSIKFGPPAYRQTRFEQPPVVKSSPTQDPTTRSQIASPEFVPVDSPLSKFVVERKR